MEGEVLGLDLCRSVLRHERKSLSGFLVFSQVNESGFPLGMCPPSPEYPRRMNSSSFSFCCPALHRRPLAVLGQKALARLRHDLAEGPKCDVMGWDGLSERCQRGCVAAGSGPSLPQQTQEWSCSLRSVRRRSWHSASLVVSKTSMPLSFQFWWSWPKGSKVTFWWWKKRNCHGQSSHVSLFATWNWT